jgi:hypothetical protein
LRARQSVTLSLGTPYVPTVLPTVRRITALARSDHAPTSNCVQMDCFNCLDVYRTSPDFSGLRYTSRTCEKRFDPTLSAGGDTAVFRSRNSDLTALAKFIEPGPGIRFVK